MTAPIQGTGSAGIASYAQPILALRQSLSGLATNDASLNNVMTKVDEALDSLLNLGRGSSPQLQMAYLTKVSAAFTSVSQSVGASSLSMGTSDITGVSSTASKGMGTTKLASAMVDHLEQGNGVDSFLRAVGEMDAEEILKEINAILSGGIDSMDELHDVLALLGMLGGSSLVNVSVDMDELMQRIEKEINDFAVSFIALLPDPESKLEVAESIKTMVQTVAPNIQIQPVENIVTEMEQVLAQNVDGATGDLGEGDTEEPENSDAVHGADQGITTSKADIKEAERAGHGVKHAAHGISVQAVNVSLLTGSLSRVDRLENSGLQSGDERNRGLLKISAKDEKTSDPIRCASCRKKVEHDLVDLRDQGLNALHPVVEKLSQMSLINISMQVDGISAA